MSYDYHQSWSRDGGPRGSGQGSGGGGGGSRSSGGGGGGRGGRGRHPAHLKGREIGLWYAKKQTQKNKEAERQEVWRSSQDEFALCSRRPWRLLELDATSAELPVTGDRSPDWLRLLPKPSLLQLMHALFKDMRTEMGLKIPAEADFI